MGNRRRLQAFLFYGVVGGIYRNAHVLLAMGLLVAGFLIFKP
ncbi:hypothetical protein [Magnetococcus sp. PR-3]